MAKMYEHECDSDEDCEVYFLKPVNEYNIVDKIKEANKELFADIADTDVVADEEHIEIAAANSSRKVTFALNLEDYEPENKEKSDVLPSIEDVDEVEGVNKVITNNKCATIEEEPNLEVEETSAQSVHETVKEVGMEPNAETTTSIEAIAMSAPAEPEKLSGKHSAKLEIHDDDDVVEEICEEIIIMDMENEKAVEEASIISIQQQRRIIKQATFDCAEEDEQDNKSLTNLLTSDGEEEESHNTITDYDNGEHDPDKSDDDDDLSLIVASYIPDDYDKISLTSEDASSNRTQSNRSKAGGKSRKIPFHKRFSLRRKTNSSNSIGSTCGITRKSQSSHYVPPEVTDLKLNYKTCCEYRNHIEQLPKYTGYLSEYGLSREALAKREANLQKQQQRIGVRTLKASQEEILKMQDNERAFTTWLKNKMRFPINKTRNMFDVKRMIFSGVSGSVGGCGSQSAVRNHTKNGKIK